MNKFCNKKKNFYYNTYNNFLVLLCTYISLGLIFIPKIRYIYKTPTNQCIDVKNSDSYSSTNCNNNSKKKKLQKKNFRHQLFSIRHHNLLCSNSQKSDEKRFQQLLKENIELQRQIDNVSFFLDNEILVMRSNSFFN